MQRHTTIAILAFAASVAILDDKATAFPKCGNQRPVYVKQITHPDVALSAIVYHLTNSVAAEDRPFIRFFWWGSTPDDRLVHDITNWSVYLNTVNSQVRIVLPVPVAGTDFRLWKVDIRDLGWTVNSFAAVAHRDRVFTEPNVDHYLAEKARRLIGVAQDQKFVHAEVVVPGPWFTWTVMNPGESDTANYYDLLYARERFGDDVIGPQIDLKATAAVQAVLAPEPQKPAERPWPGGAWTGDDAEKGKYFPPGAFNYIPLAEHEKWKKDHAEWVKAKTSPVVPTPSKNPRIDLPIGAAFAGKAIKDFPENLAQFQERWGQIANRKFLDGIKIFVDKGAVVAGSYNDLRRGSMVAYNDRVIRIQNGEFNNGGRNMDTQDFARTSGRKNPANLQLETTLGQLEEDAGENLYTLPNGLQAALIHGAAKEGRKRVDHADSKFVHSSLDPRDVTIWDGYSSCCLCHARSHGVLAPTNNKVKEARAKGLRLNFLTKDDQLRAESFFDIEEYTFEQARMPFKAAVERATKLTEAAPWNGTQWAEATSNFIAWFNTPITLDQAAAELGVPKIIVLLACKNLLGEDNKGNFGSKAIFVDFPIGRAEWEDDVQPELQKVIAVMRDIEHPNPVLSIFHPELLRQSVEKLESIKGGKK
jgi:translation elongation factor P/translation initiation factor 5A